MRLASFDPCLEPAVRELARALGRLEDEQGRVARSNARAAVAKSLRKIREEVDEAWPAQRKRAGRRKRRTPQQRVERLRLKGWVTVGSQAILARLVGAKVTIRTVKHGNGVEQPMAPQWAATIASEAPKKLARAQRHAKERRAILTELALKEGE
jgi:hypothetical protein